MCGIFASHDRERVYASLLDMQYRGPDKMRIRTANEYSIGFNRLAIVDTNAYEARQPQETDKGNLVAFNGEIYNYKQLDPNARSEIELLGQMLDAGLDVRGYLDGDYAIVYYEPSIRKLTLYRDRFGACPLYYDKNRHTVSSERRRIINPSEVPAHGRVTIDMNKCKAEVDKWSQYGATCESYYNQADVFANIFSSAVRSRAKHTDSGFSLALSGGLDSTALLYSLYVQGLTPQALICVALPGAEEDLRFATMAAHFVRGEKLIQAVHVSAEEIEADTPRILQHLDQTTAPGPVKWRGAIRNWFVAKHSPTRVILSGEGADELLAGYPTHHRASAKAGHDAEYKPWEKARKCISTIDSMPHINLDRTNKLGMAWSKEYRMPFLASTLSYFLLSTSKESGKQMLRKYLYNLGCPQRILDRGKYSTDEAILEKTLPKPVEENA